MKLQELIQADIDEMFDADYQRQQLFTPRFIWKIEDLKSVQT